MISFRRLFSSNTVLECIKLSESCIKRINEIANGKYLRITVEGGGCSGFQYKFSFDTVKNSDDILISKEGANVVIDDTSIEYIKGSTLEFHQELIKSSFRIVNNPLAEQGCSCGASFSVKDL